MGRTLTRGLALVAVVVAAVVGASARLSPAADAFDPPMGPLVDRADRSGVVSIGLPAEAAVNAEWGKGDESALGAFTLDLDKAVEGPEITVYLQQRPQFARAELAGSAGWGMRFGTLEEDSVVVKDGEWRDQRIDRSQNALYFQRIVAAKGAVFFVVVQTTVGDADRLRPHVDAILASLKVVAEPKMLPLPDGYDLTSSGGRDVWTDGKKADTDRVIREWGTAVALWPKVLAAKPVMTNAPRLILCSKDEDFDAIVTYGKSASSVPFVQYDSLRRAVVVRLTKRRDEDLYDALYRAAGEQMVEYQFGGRCPLWLQQGLRMYLKHGVNQSGHFEQTFADLLEKTKASVAKRQSSLADLMAATEAPREGRNDFDRELFAWHWYVRHGPGAKTLATRYNGYIDTLRKTGDLRAAQKSWDGVDHDALKKEFLTWMEKWKGKGG